MTKTTFATICVGMTALLVVANPVQSVATTPPKGAIRYMNQDHANTYVLLVCVLIAVKLVAGLIRIARKNSRRRAGAHSSASPDAPPALTIRDPAGVQGRSSGRDDDLAGSFLSRLCQLCGR
jgi:hypothetical protein